MSLLNSNIRNQVKAAFEARMKDPVRLVLFTQGQGAPGGALALECESCAETHDLLGEVAALSPKIALEVKDLLADGDDARRLGVDKIPAIAVLREDGSPGGRDYGVRFYGIPSGYEFGTLIEDVLLVSGAGLELSADTFRQLAGLDRPVHIQVYTTPT